MLEGLMKGLAVWLYNLLLEIVEFIADSLLQVFNMDLAYFKTNVPVTSEIVKIIMAAGWAILIGNLAFQAIKSMMSGIGFEGEDPKILFCRTFVFSFLLLASRQICEIGLGITSKVNTLLQMPDAVRLGLPPLDVFIIPGSWLLVIIMGVIVMCQIIKFFFEIAERYVVLVMLTILAPLAFGVGGSKNTEDIFKGWARMFGSSCLMMLFNTVFLKLLLSAMSNTPSATGMLPWMLLVVAIARVARKIDEIVARIGLNTARTGDPIGRGGIMYPLMMMRNLSGIVGKTIGGAAKVASSIPKAGTWGGGIPIPRFSLPSSGPAPASGGGSSPNPPVGGDAVATPSPPSGPASGGASPPGTDNNAQPTRPPVGFQGGGRGRKQASEPQQSPAAPEQGKIFGGGGKSRGSGAGRSSARGFVSQGEFGGHGNNSANGSSEPRLGGGRGGNPESSVRAGETQPTLSADTRTPGASATPGQASGGKGYQRNGRYKKTPNIDIHCDDDPPVRPSQNRTPAPNSTRPSTAQGGAGRPSAITPPAGAAAAAQKGTQGNNTVQAGAVQPQISPAPVSASSPGAGRIAGLNQSGGLSQSGGTTVPGDSHRATSVSGQTRPSRISTPVSDGARPQSAGSADTRSGERSARAKAPAGAQPHSGVHPQGQPAARETGSTLSASGRSVDAQKPRPMRYKRVDRSDNRGEEKNTGQPPLARPAPGRQPPEHGPSRGGGNRP